MPQSYHEWLDPSSCLETVKTASTSHVQAAMATQSPDLHSFAVLLSESAGMHIEDMARHAQAITRRQFGRSISLYAPLYLSNYCSGGCAYCGFASDREQLRRKLNHYELAAEIRALADLGFEDVLLLTGERTKEADFAYLRDSVAIAARHFHSVSVESFAMSLEQYGQLQRAGCTGITLYQETYNPERYDILHRWGAKKDYDFRLEAPGRALEAGLRTVGLGVLLGLSDPVEDIICLFRHVQALRRSYWKGGIMLSFPRICHEVNDFSPGFSVDERFLAQVIFAFRICLPDVPLVLSTRERSTFRNGIAGIGINRMSIASKTSVGGYDEATESTGGQFDIRDERDVETFCAMLRQKDLEPVFKNWDAVFQANE